MRRMNCVLSLAMCACVFGYAGPALHAAIISSSGLLAEYGYETSSGAAVADGQSAAGAQIDDTGLNPAGANHAIGSPFVAGASMALQYSSDVPAAIAAGSSLSFGMPETNLNYVSVPIVPDSALDNIGLGDFRV